MSQMQAAAAAETQHPDEDAQRRAELRAGALFRFRRRYRHNPHSQATMIGSLRRVALTASDGCHDENSFPWELISDDLAVEDLWRAMATRYAATAVRRDLAAVSDLLRICNKFNLLSAEAYLSASSFQAPPPRRWR
jgi:hypothetical protein